MNGPNTGFSSFLLIMHCIVTLNGIVEKCDTQKRELLHNFFLFGWVITILKDPMRRATLWEIVD